MFSKRLKNTYFFPIFMMFFCLISCSAQNRISIHNHKSDGNATTQIQEIVVGANNLTAYLPLLNGKNIAIVANQTSVIFKKNGYTYLVDSLLSLRINITKVFSP